MRTFYLSKNFMKFCNRFRDVILYLQVGTPTGGSRIKKGKGIPYLITKNIDRSIKLSPNRPKKSGTGNDIFPCMGRGFF